MYDKSVLNDSENISDNVSSDTNKCKKSYAFFQPTIFILLYLLYFCTYLIRKSLSIGTMGAATSLNFDAGIYSNLSMFYYVVCFIGYLFGGVAADKFNVRTTLPLVVGVAALFSCGMVGCEFLYHMGILPFGSVVLYMYTAWTISALVQSMAFVMCLKLFASWYSDRSRVYFMSGWFTSHGLGAIISILLVSFMMQSVNSEMVFLAPAFITVSICIVGFILLRDKPEDVGLPNIRKICGECKQDNDDMPFLKQVKKEVVSNKLIWLLGIVLFCVFVLSHGPVDFLRLHFTKTEWGVISPLIVRTFLIPICGILGVLVMPLLSEKILKGNRILALLLYISLGVICMTIIRIIESYYFFKAGMFTAILEMVLLSLMVMSIYGSIMMINVIVVQSVSKRVVASAVGFVSAISYLGSIIVMLFWEFTKIFNIDFLMNVWEFTYLIAFCIMFFLYKKSIKRQ